MKFWDWFAVIVCFLFLQLVGVIWWKTQAKNDPAGTIMEAQHLLLISPTTAEVTKYYRAWNGGGAELQEWAKKYIESQQPHPKP